VTSVFRSKPCLNCNEKIYFYILFCASWFSAQVPFFTAAPAGDQVSGFGFEVWRHF
jgi:hypothetical protein